MRISIVILVIVSMLLVFSAGKSRRPQEETIDKTDKEIIDAIKYAYSLEEVLWDNDRKMKSKADVFNHFIKGFSEEKAKDLANYFWMEDRDESGEKVGMLRAGDSVLIIPDSVEVLSKSEERAEALLKYKAVEEGPVTYKAHSVRVRLKKENGIWKIYEADARRY
ncbi:MAG: hypothetical protein JSV25_09530 [Spirochaetota bacterium]|nr:MAG: hypothetical protein JSV25_09530 [Spirochaetota bacterium]